MVTSFQQVTVDFAGTAKQQKIASEVFGAMCAHGRFMAQYAPIRIEIESLLAFLSEREIAEPAAAKTAIPRIRLFFRLKRMTRA